MRKGVKNEGKKVEIITICDEILIGQIVDTNSAWMARELNKEGFRVAHITSVADDEAEIMEAIDRAFDRVDCILVTGGLGPTKDDITKQTLCKYFETQLVFDPKVIDNINELFKNRPTVLNDLTFGQAYVPEAATIIQNLRGTAPVTWFEREQQVLVSMPGVPYEMKWVMSEEVLPRLRNFFQTPSLLHQTVLVYNVPESGLAIQLTDWENSLPACIKLAYLPSPGLVKLRLTGSLPNRAELKQLFSEKIIDLRTILGDSILAEEDIPVEELIGKLLKAKNLTLATAESCTGGNIAHVLTSVAGSSAYFKGGVVSYSNEVKEDLLGVEPTTLLEHGAVSQEVVEAMAKGALRLLKSDLTVGVSGIAGPDGGTPEKPVGTVWICVCNQTDSMSRKFQFGNLRMVNIERATLSALAMIKEFIENQRI